MQGTIGLELLDQVPDLDAILVPASAGGMASGICIAAKSLKPDIKGIYHFLKKKISNKIIFKRKYIPNERCMFSVFVLDNYYLISSLKYIFAWPICGFWYFGKNIIILVKH